MLPRNLMNLSDEQASAAFKNRALLPLMVVVTLALGWILLPFYGAILWGSIIALLFTPVYRRLLARLKWRRTPAALLTLLLVLLVLILPFALLTAALAREAAQVYQHLQSGEINPSLYFQGVEHALKVERRIYFPRLQMLIDLGRFARKRGGKQRKRQNQDQQDEQQRQQGGLRAPPFEPCQQPPVYRREQQRND